MTEYHDNFTIRAGNGLYSTAFLDLIGRTASITEIEGNNGPSVTNAAEHFAKAIGERFGILVVNLRLWEIYPIGIDDRTEETIDRIFIDPGGRPSWKHSNRRELEFAFEEERHPPADMTSDFANRLIGEKHGK